MRLYKDCEKLDLLVIDDDELIARMLKRILGTTWRKVDVASSVEEGVWMILNNNYDVVLSDWDCPQKGVGIRIIQETIIPVVVHTASPDVKNEGITTLEKPVDISEINEALLNAWRKGERKGERKRK